MNIDFTKMHGLGNDFLVIDCRTLSLPDSFSWPEFSRKACHRRFGVGADQIILLFPAEKADFRMGIYNADGSEVEMCGNGIRCLAKFVWDKGISAKETLAIETLAGIIRPQKAGDLVRVDMGEPIFEPEKVPVQINEAAGMRREGRDGKILDYPLQVEDREFPITCVSMGNPHAVIFLDEDIAAFPVTHYGPFIENHAIFPRRTNVEFVNLKARDELSMRVWERGSGETMACGTGASATGVAAMVKGVTERKVTIHLLGGDLIIEWLEQDNHVYMTGPAVEVFEGRISYGS